MYFTIMRDFMQNREKLHQTAYCIRKYTLRVPVKKPAEKQDFYVDFTRIEIQGGNKVFRCSALCCFEFIASLLQFFVASTDINCLPDPVKELIHILEQRFVYPPNLLNLFF